VKAAVTAHTPHNLKIWPDRFRPCSLPYSAVSRKSARGLAVSDATLCADYPDVCRRKRDCRRSLWFDCSVDELGGGSWIGWLKEHASFITLISLGPFCDERGALRRTPIRGSPFADNYLGGFYARALPI